MTELFLSCIIAKVTVMNKILEQALLYDFYGELLTTHQKEVYEQFILDDLSLSEIAESAAHPLFKGFVEAALKKQNETVQN